MIKSAQIITPEGYTGHCHAKAGLKDRTVSRFITGGVSCPRCRNCMRTSITAASPKKGQFSAFFTDFLHPSVNIFCIQIGQQIMSFISVHSIVEYNILRYCFRKICFNDRNAHADDLLDPFSVPFQKFRICKVKAGT